MCLDNKKVGEQIALLRYAKKMTQADLAERLNISFQAVSKWERGENLPDVSILPQLANALDTTIDNVLCGNVRKVAYRGTIKVADMIEGIKCLQKLGDLLGKENKIYISAIKGIDDNMNTSIEPAFSDDFLFEAFVAEAIIQNLMAGMYVEITDVRRNFKHEHFANVVCEYARKYNIV